MVPLGLIAMLSPLALSLGEPPHVEAFFLRPSAPNSATKAKPPKTSGSFVSARMLPVTNRAPSAASATSSPPPNPGPPIFCHTSVPDVRVEAVGFPSEVDTVCPHRQLTPAWRDGVRKFPLNP